MANEVLRCRREENAGVKRISLYPDAEWRVQAAGLADVVYLLPDFVKR